MDICEVLITQELSDHFNAVEKLGAEAFGPGRFARTAFRLREGVPHEKELSFVALKNDLLVGSVRITKIDIDTSQALILGPLVVKCRHKSEGIGAKLMLNSARVCKEFGYELIILVGDEPYYRPFGYKKIPSGQIILPGPVEPARLLYCELKQGAMATYSGKAKVHRKTTAPTLHEQSGSNS